MAPCNGTTSTPLKLVVTPTLQLHPAMAPRHSPNPLSPSTLQWHPAMAPRPLHPAMAPWCHVQSAKVVRRPPPLLEVRTPIAIAIWGKKKRPLFPASNMAHFFRVCFFHGKNQHKKKSNQSVDSWALLTNSVQRPTFTKTFGKGWYQHVP